MKAGRIGPIYAYGKINWSLLVTGVRPDGYHTLDTVMQRISLKDEMTLVPDAQWSVQCDDARIPSNGENTALAAAKAYARAAVLKDAYAISIVKHIPAGAGLGGGSADAAAVLKALNDRYGALSDAELFSLALSIGADVPFCLFGGCARCTGIGETMDRAKGAGEFHLVLAGCGAALSTARVFQRYDGLLAGESGRRSTDIPLLGEFSVEAIRGLAGFGDPEEEEDFPDMPCETGRRSTDIPPDSAGTNGPEGADEENGSANAEDDARADDGDETDDPGLDSFSLPQGGDTNTALISALSAGSPEGVAAAMKAFSPRLRESDVKRAVSICRIPCDVRYAGEAGCTLCVARAKRVLCAANDLTAAACALDGGVSETILRLHAAGALAVSMSGSGSACFGLFKNEKEAKAAAKKLADLPFCQVCVTRA